MLHAIAKDARNYREWFDFAAGELTSSGQELCPSDMAERFCAGDNEFNGRRVQQNDRREVGKAFSHTLTVAERCGLVSGRLETRYTQNIGLASDVRVARLTPKGLRWTKASPWRRETTFAIEILRRLLGRVWRPFAGAVAAAGTIATLLRLVLLWETEKAAIAAGIAGVGVFLGAMFRLKP